MTAEYVPPFVDSVEAVEPPPVEVVEPFVDSVESSVPIEEPVLPIFAESDVPEQQDGNSPPPADEPSGAEG